MAAVPDGIQADIALLDAANQVCASRGVVVYADSACTGHGAVALFLFIVKLSLVCSLRLFSFCLLFSFLPSVCVCVSGSDAE